MTDFSLSIVGVTWFKVAPDTYTNYVLEHACTDVMTPCRDAVRRVTMYSTTEATTEAATTPALNLTEVQVSHDDTSAARENTVVIMWLFSALCFGLGAVVS